MFERFPPPDRAELACLAACAAAGALGLLPGAAGPNDPVTLLGWLALFAPAAGVLRGARGPGLFPFALAVPGAWGLLLVFALSTSERVIPSPLWPACVLAGLFAAGFALGRRARAPLGAAGGVLLIGLVLSGASVGFGLAAGGAELARRHPAAAARLVDLSPLVLVFDSAGWDWTHAQPEVYARSGVEWFQRRPYRGSLAGPGALVVGCALAWLARAPRRSERAR